MDFILLEQKGGLSMPSQTFFNLPEEKRKRLLKAARKEFSRTTFDSASINRIIQDAEISRGSFYMYFEDKEDLFLYLQTDAMEQLRQKVNASLEASNGDLFTLIEDLFDQTYLIFNNEENRHLMRNMSEYVRIVRENSNEKPDQHGHGKRFLNVLMETTSQINTENLRVENPEELREAFVMLWSTLPHCISQLFLNKVSQEEAKEQFLRQLDWLKYGLLKDRCTEGK